MMQPSQLLTAAATAAMAITSQILNRFILLIFSLDDLYQIYEIYLCAAMFSRVCNGHSASVEKKIVSYLIWAHIIDMPTLV